MTFEIIQGTPVDIPDIGLRVMQNGTDKPWKLERIRSDGVLIQEFFIPPTAWFCYSTKQVPYVPLWECDVAMEWPEASDSAILHVRHVTPLDQRSLE